ncbi:MAG: MucR family transcriptional regulator [Gemmatimonadetes bacterium]|nr:MucR family transcriptional regulator [Gemmatimonadota bacterium]
MPDQHSEADLLEATSRIVATHVSNNAVATTDLARLIITVHQALTDLGEKPLSPAVPAVPIKKSVRPDYIICLDDGKKFKMLKGHLRTAYDMSPEEYRAKWNLPSDYPMVAPKYAEYRSELAKKINFGRKRGRKARVRRTATR